MSAIREKTGAMDACGSSQEGQVFYDDHSDFDGNVVAITFHA